MHVVIGGGSGFIGSALGRVLRERGDSVTIISRSAGAGRITWDRVEKGYFPECDAVVNLAGQHILDVRRRWTAKYRDEVIASRVDTTKALVRTLNSMPKPPAVFVSTAGKCFYGTGELGKVTEYPELTEDSEPMGIDFPAELVALWERAAEGIDTKRIRHVRVRIGVVLGSVERKSHLGKLWRIGRARGFLPIIRLPFCLGVGRHFGPWQSALPLDPYRRHGRDTAACRRRLGAIRSVQRRCPRNRDQPRVYTPVCTASEAPRRLVDTFVARTPGRRT
jgi:NAD dependent epimerase/dehydratase family enzyme